MSKRKNNIAIPIIIIRDVNNKNNKLIKKTTKSISLNGKGKKSS